MEIKEILSKYDTDKIYHHRYGDAYNDIFSLFDRESILNILEVGTQKGGSLLAWKEYFPNANVYGIDIIDVVSEEYRKDGVTRIISDIKDWKNNIQWDIVIDDGSHHLGDIVYVITQYSMKLNKNGVIVIEDVRHPDLLMGVIKNILEEIWLVFPNYKEKGAFDVKNYDNRRLGAESSFIMAMKKR